MPSRRQPDQQVRPLGCVACQLLALRVAGNDHAPCLRLRREVASIFKGKSMEKGKRSNTPRSAAWLAMKGVPAHPARPHGHVYRRCVPNLRIGQQVSESAIWLGGALAGPEFLTPPLFPCLCSIVGHFSPVSDDTSTIKAGDVVKMWVLGCMGVPCTQLLHEHSTSLWTLD